ncbi:GGDEF domain-containing protein [Reinekea forsetii]|nr:GGDEF domain-containing protein [Reinekea forsetii]
MASSFTQHDFGTQAKNHPFPMDVSSISIDSLTPDRLKDFRLHLFSHLQTTLEIEQLIDIFYRHLKQLIPVSGIEYNHADKMIDMHVGRINKHRCNYQLNMSQQHFGDIAFTRSKRFSEKELSTIESIMDVIIFPLRNALKYRDALSTAMIDPLTGLNNRGAMSIALTRELERTRRHEDQDMSLMMIDIDHFKTINDRYGHLSGDDVLRQVARVIQQSIRASDACFRFGGEEFVILVTNTHLAHSRTVSERIRIAIEEQVKLPDKDLKVTASLGLAHYNGESDWPELLNRADKALYSAKQQGRNCVVTSLVKKPQSTFAE